MSEVNDVSAFAGRRRRAGFPFSERVSGGIVNMEPEMEDKTLELMVRVVSLWHPGHPKCPVSLFYRGKRRGSTLGRNGLKRLVGRGGRERRGDQKTEGGPEIIDTFC